MSKLILVGEGSLKRALQQYLIYYRAVRNHLGKDNKLLFSRQTQPVLGVQQPVQSQQRLGRLLKYYYRQAA